MNRGKFFTRNFRKFFKLSDGSRNARTNFEADDEINMKNINRPKALNSSGHDNKIVTNIINIKNCLNNADILNYFESAVIDKGLQNEEDVLVFKVQLDNNFLELDSNWVRELNKKYANKSVVVQIESIDDRMLKLFWKPKDFEEFLELKQTKKLNLKAEQNLNAYLVDFLVQSLRNNHSGLLSKFTFQTGSNSMNLDLLADSRDFNLLLLAAEQGNSEIVEILVQMNLSENSMDNSVNAQTIAVDGQHFDVLQVLLQNNLKFPAILDISKFTGKLREFCEVTENVHGMIRANDKKALEDTLEQHKNLRHFYNFMNESALKVAIDSGSFDIFDLLLSRKFRFGSHEDPAEYYEELDVASKRKVRDIQNKYSQPFLDKHIHILVSNSTACYDETEAEDKHDYVQRAFKLLNENLFIKIILRIVAASKNFKIVFDFNHEAVNVADPTTNSATQGIFYLSGKIFIGAKQLLNPATEHETLAVLAHELCHFAMNVAYRNKSKPYKSEYKKTMDAFEDISKECEKQSEKEEVIGSVYEFYPQEAFHRELIVRVVHLLALYRNVPEKISEVRRNFIKLFEFYEMKVVPELEKAVPEIEGHELKMKDKEISKFKKYSIIGGILAITGIFATIVVALLLYTPIYKFSELSINDQEIIAKSPIIYKGTDLKFCDLFPKGSPIYDQLLSDQISQMFKGKPLNLSDPHLHFLDDQVIHNWQNLTGKLRNKFLSSNFTFQDESLKFKRLHKISQEAFSSLNSSQILDVLNGNGLIVNRILKNESQFYVERTLWNEHMPDIYFEFMNIFDWKKFNESNSKKERLKLFDNFYRDFIGQDMKVQIEKIKDIKKYNFMDTKQPEKLLIKYHNSEVVIDSFLWHESLYLDFNQAFKIANESKLFILSAEAGTGKTETFQQFTLRIKRESPTSWVSYIDLKDHKELYRSVVTLLDVKKMLKIIFKVSSENAFEEKIFDNFFESGRLILLWNGFDEISPDHSEDVMRILGLIRNETQNIQFICTRPLYSDQLSLKLKTITHTLIPFNDKEQENFVKTFLKSRNIEDETVPNYIKKVQKITNSTESTDSFDTPLMLIMIADLIARNAEIRESENLYEIYQSFIKSKIDFWKNNSEFARDFNSDLISEYRNFDFLKVYQSYAMKSEFQQNHFSNAYFYCLKLKIMREKIPDTLTSDEISRMGILFINGLRIFRFAHKTFQEFFIAQYLVDSIYKADDDPLDPEAEFRLLVFYASFEFPGVTKFINSFLKSKDANKSTKFNSQILKQLNTNFSTLFMKSMRYGTNTLITLFNFFKKDLKITKKLLQIDENKTLYTALFCSTTYPSYKFEYNPLKTVVRPYLTDTEFEKFINGKNQKGIILKFLYELNALYSTLKYPHIYHDNYFLNESIIAIKDPVKVFHIISNDLTKDEIKEFIKSAYFFFHNKKYGSTESNGYEKKIWDYIEETFSDLEQKEILESFIDKISTSPFYVNIEFYSEKIIKHFKNDIFQILGKYNLFRDIVCCHFLWDIFVGHTTREQQKAYLKAEKFKQHPVKYNLNPPLNVLMISTFRQSTNDLNVTVKIYESYFNETEMQGIIVNSTADFLPFFTLTAYYEQNFIDYLAKLFAENHESLKEFLLKKIEPTDKNVFELLSDYNDFKGTLKRIENLLNL